MYISENKDSVPPGLWAVIKTSVGGSYGRGVSPPPKTNPSCLLECSGNESIVQTTQYAWENNLTRSTISHHRRYSKCRSNIIDPPAGYEAWFNWITCPKAAIERCRMETDPSIHQMLTNIQAPIYTNSSLTHFNLLTFLSILSSHIKQRNEVANFTSPTSLTLHVVKGRDTFSLGFSFTMC